MNCSNDKEPRPRRANSADMRAGCDPILFESVCAVFFFLLLSSGSSEKKRSGSLFTSLYLPSCRVVTLAREKVPTKSQMIPDRKDTASLPSPRHGERNRLFPFTLYFHSPSSLFDGRTQINRQIVEKSNIERTSSYRSVIRFVVRWSSFAIVDDRPNKVSAKAASSSDLSSQQLETSCNLVNG